MLNSKTMKTIKANIPNIATRIIEVYHIVIDNPEHKKEVVNKLDSHIEALLYNVASIASITALLDEKDKIELKHISFIKDYITKECIKKKKGSKQSGGSFPAEYFGYDSGAYTESNYGGTNYTDSVWTGSDAVIRQAIPIMVGGTSGGACNDTCGMNRVVTVGGMKGMKDIVGNTKEVVKYIKRVMEFNNVKISKPAMAELLKIVNIHLNCLGDDMSQLEKLKVKTMEKIFKSRKYAVFK